jgi:hypothetical protein
VASPASFRINPGRARDQVLRAIPLRQERSGSLVAAGKAAFRLFDIPGHFGKPLLRGLQRLPDGARRSGGNAFLQMLDLIFREILQPHHAVLGVLVRADKFVQFELCTICASDRLAAAFHAFSARA